MFFHLQSRVPKPKSLFYIPQVSRNQNYFFISHMLSETRITFYIPHASRNQNYFFISHMLPETRITFLYPTCFPKPELLFISQRSHETEITFCFPLGCEESEVLSSVFNPFRLNFRRLFLEFRFNESIGFVFSFVDYIYFEGFRIAEYIEIMS